MLGLTKVFVSEGAVSWGAHGTGLSALSSSRHDQLVSCDCLGRPQALCTRGRQTFHNTWFMGNRQTGALMSIDVRGCFNSEGHALLSASFASLARLAILTFPSLRYPGQRPVDPSSLSRGGGQGCDQQSDSLPRNPRAPRHLAEEDCRAPGPPIQASCSSSASWQNARCGYPTW